MEDNEAIALPRLQRLWRYYRNALAEPSSGGGSSGPPAQRAGLPKRLLDVVQLQRDDRFKREVVIENDIAWRIHTLVDFMFPAAPRIISKASDLRVRTEIESLLSAIIEANGGIALWQNAALLGSVYGHVDFLLDCDALSDVSPGAAPSKPSFADLVDRIRSSVFIETVEAPRAIPLLSRHDYRVLDAYILHFQQPVNDVEHDTMLRRLSRALRLTNASGAPGSRRSSAALTQLIS